MKGRCVESCGMWREQDRKREREKEIEGERESIVFRQRSGV